MRGEGGRESERKEGASQGVHRGGNSLPMAQRVENISIPSCYAMHFWFASGSKVTLEGTLGKDLCLRVQFSWKPKLRLHMKEPNFNHHCFKKRICMPLKTMIGSHMEWTLLKGLVHRCRAWHWTAGPLPRVVGLKLSQITRHRKKEWGTHMGK